MTLDEALDILHRGCDGKLRYSPPTAESACKHALEERGVVLHPYRCLIDARHWHIGKMPTIERFRQIAEALRVRAGCAPGVAA